MVIEFGKLLKDGKAMFLAYDQGMEHGPADFDRDNVDPAKIVEIAELGSFTGIILHKGTAEKYYDQKVNKVPLVIKLNGKTNFVKDADPVSLQVCSVKEAVWAGASAVGYTIYVGSEFEPEMLIEFGKITEEAHSLGLPVIGWMYPRGRNVKDENDPKVIAYAARVGLELGADMVKIKYTGDIASMKWAVACAGKAKVVLMGGGKEDEKTFLTKVEKAILAGAVGVAVGRNVWQASDPMGVARKLREAIWG